MDTCCFRILRRVCAWLFWLAIFFSTGVSQAKESPIVVLFPDTPRPYSAVFTGIISGIEDAAASDVDVVEFRVEGLARDTNRLRQLLERSNPRAVITLGRTPLQLYEAVRGGRPAPIVGALDATPETHPNFRGVGLSADPDVLFGLLKAVSPNTRRVLLVYNPDRDASLVELAHRSARRHNLQLRTFTAKDLSESTSHYRNFFRYSNPNTDAIWLTVDAGLVDDSANLPRIIEDSWVTGMPVFSNNLAHANKGVLFAVYPDPQALGRRLFTLSQEPIAATPSIQPLKDTNAAINKKVADHLNLKLPASVRRQFDLVLDGR